MLSSAGTQWPLEVLAENATSPLAIATRQRENRALLGGAPAAAAQSMRAMPLPRWPFFLAWLAATTLLWVLERARPRASS